MERVKFIEYTGKWPNLCSGELTLEIEGKKVIFNPYETKGFGMCSGGSCGFTDSDYSDSYIHKGEWSVDVPKEYEEYKKEIEDVVNSNVSWGCCGGCL